MERCRGEGQNFQPLKQVQRLEEEEEELISHLLRVLFPSTVQR